MMQRDQEESSALRTDDQWTTLAGAVARIAAGHSLSRGAALKVLQQAGISGEVPARGVYFGMRLPLGTDDWRGSQIDPETGALVLVGGLLGRITQVTLATADLDWWLEQRYAAQGKNDTAAGGDLPPSGVRTRAEETAEEKCLAWFAGLPPKPRKSKAIALAEAKTTFGQSLSDSAFSRVWHAEAPKKDWNKPGRPRTKNAPG